MKIRAIDIFIVASLFAHTSLLVNYLPEKPGGIQSGNDLNITFEPVAIYKKHELSEKVLKQHIPIPENNRAYKNRKNTYEDKKIVAKSTVANRPLSSSMEYKSDGNKNLESKKNTEQSHGGHILRNKINFLLANNFYYPPMARKNNWHGTVEISLRIESDGSISRITLAKSSGYDILDNAAMDNLRNISVIPDAHKWLGNSYYEMTLPIEYRLIDS